jgi:hypothetical protein
MFTFKKSKNQNNSASKPQQPKTPIEQINDDIEALYYALYLGNTDPSIVPEIERLKQKKAALIRQNLQRTGLR